MLMKTNPKSRYISFRVPNDTKIAFKKVAEKRGLKMSDILIDFVEKQIKKERVSKKIVDENQTEIPME